MTSSTFDVISTRGEIESTGFYSVSIRVACKKVFDLRRKRHHPRWALPRREVVRSSCWESRWGRRSESCNNCDRPGDIKDCSGISWAGGYLIPLRCLDKDTKSASPSGSALILPFCLILEHPPDFPVDRSQVRIRGHICLPH